MKDRIQALENVIIDEIISLAKKVKIDDLEKFRFDQDYEIDIETYDKVKSDIRLTPSPPSKDIN